MERLLESLSPDGLARLQGATEDEVAQIERFAGRPLPKFYRWFLRRMGRNLGPFSSVTLDYSAPTILSCFADEEMFPPRQRFHLIGFETNDMMPLHLRYDFEFPTRDDARVVLMEAPEGDVYQQFETFREMFAWGKFRVLRVEKFTQKCHGLFVDDDGDVVMKLDPILKSLGFENAYAVPTGPLCSLYNRANAALVAHSTPGFEPSVHSFSFGGSDAAVLRRTLGEIATESSISVQVKRWEPPLE
jgi:hypothetical protein